MEKKQIGGHLVFSCKKNILILLISYEMLVGIPPFYSKNQHTMLCQIIKEKFKFPNGIKISAEARDLINGVRNFK